MFDSIEKFIGTWTDESSKTESVLDALTDESLDQSVAAGHRRLGAMAWHLVRTGSSMLRATGLAVSRAASTTLTCGLPGMRSRSCNWPLVPKTRTRCFSAASSARPATPTSGST